ncbi:V-type ATP synthase subunit B [candidate division KSB3 bacterium]|uniref:V-type ATP synthase beta chain n=1 Tax=candidate division KSB3 bacterium TaxID=2044937 RepID=A0A2G6EA48_9BACT|nr:MAG: V-type ATP synthase subunit B [candidate division KSB3 bacterium]PIE29589.1 MAG: V-type ATP synthase subunit B [candidate division KSB3 bacterium]
MREYLGFKKVSGPILYMEGVADIGFGEVVHVEGSDGTIRHGRVLSVGRSVAAVEIFEGTSGLAIDGTKVRFLGHPLTIPVTEHMLGRVFNGIGEAIDGLPEPIANERRNINGAPINPASREYPRDFIQTGISSIDGMNTLVRGQKLPVFSGSGLPHNKLAAQIVRQATIIGEEDTQFSVVFGAMGIKHDDAEVFRHSFEESGVLSNVVMFTNLASDPPIERLVTPRSALTIAEYLAFDCGMHVLVVLTDMTNYCEALREVSTSKGEVPSRKGYPGYLYSDLASIYERAGRIVGRTGSITQIPILTMPNDDITHPIPDLTGFITEGQIVLDRNLEKQGIYPPINVLPSLSRLMNDGIGEGKTREDHRNISNQLYSAYTYVKRVETLASIIGESELSDLDKQYLEVGRQFETMFTQQGPTENRTIEETLNLAWQLASTLPRRELTRVTDEQIAEYGQY